MGNEWDCVTGKRPLSGGSEAGGTVTLDDGIRIGIVVALFGGEENWGDRDKNWMCCWGGDSMGFSLYELGTLDDGDMNEEWNPRRTILPISSIPGSMRIYLNFEIPMSCQYSRVTTVDTVVYSHASEYEVISVGMAYGLASADEIENSRPMMEDSSAHDDDSFQEYSRWSCANVLWSLARTSLSRPCCHGDLDVAWFYNEDHHLESLSFSEFTSARRTHDQSKSKARRMNVFHAR